jgi:hypothetical protein
VIAATNVDVDVIDDVDVIVVLDGAMDAAEGPCR